MVSSFKHKVYNFSGHSLEIFRLFKDEPFCFFLDSSLPEKLLGHFSFIGFDPFEIFKSKDKDVFDDLRKRFNKYSQLYKKISQKISIPLTSGIVGYFGYDLGFQLEKIRRQTQDDLSIPDCFFGFYDAIIIIDHWTSKLHVVSTGLPETNQHLREKRAEYRLEKIVKKLAQYDDQTILLTDHDTPIDNAEDIPLPSNFTKETYQQAVLKALDYIRRGDIYQVNLAQRFMLNMEDNDKINPFDLYQALRISSPSCFGGYLDGGDFKILSASPERLLKFKKNIVSTRPMKGTRPRGKNKTEDEKFGKELLQSKKEKAELLMITDLERNDLGRVCVYGSIKVKQLRTLERYKTVFQTTATVEGILNKNKDCFDLIRVSFPGGSVTGCPKIRAMEVIEELEGVRRGFYTGSLGYISFSGEMDFNVLIRSLLLKEKNLYFYVGSGIVADSKPSDEYEETQIKSKALRETIARTIFSKVHI